jgi:hypothetical protein
MCAVGGEKGIGKFGLDRLGEMSKQCSALCTAQAAASLLDICRHVFTSCQKVTVRRNGM